MPAAPFASADAANVAELEALLQRALDNTALPFGSAASPSGAGLVDPALDPALLAVYADALQQRGDPRGEWIALALRCEAVPGDRALRAARDAAVRRWLGDGEPPEQDGWDLTAFRLGFIDDIEVTGPRTAELLAASPAGAFARSVTVRADALGIAKALRVLARKPLPWLARVVIDHDGGGLIDGEALAQLAGMAPHLDELDLRGRRAVVAPLPAVARLRLEVGALIGSAPLPGVTELDLAFPGATTAEMREAAAMLAIERLPDLRHLDLARNEPAAPASRTLDHDVLPLVAALPSPARLASLRLPALRTRAQRAAVLATLDALPALRIDIARGYRAFADIVDGLAHPRLRMPAPWPWPPPEQRSSREALRVIIPAGPAGSAGSAGSAGPAGSDGEDTLALTHMLWLIERAPARWSAAAFASWHALWSAIDGLPYRGESGTPPTAPFPAALLAVGLDEFGAIEHRCAEVAARLHALPPGAEVALQRYWGW